MNLEQNVYIDKLHVFKVWFEEFFFSILKFVCLCGKVGSSFTVFSNKIIAFEF